MDIISLLLILPIMLLSSGVHEFAHAYSAYLMGDFTAKAEGRMTMNPFAHIDLVGLVFMLVAKIGWSKPVPINPYNFNNPLLGQAIVAAAGPFSNIILVVLLAILMKVLSVVFPAALIILLPIFSLAIIINISLALFNLLPIPPLDGGNIIEIFLPKSIQERWGEISTYSPILLLLLFLPISPIAGIFTQFWYNLLTTITSIVFTIVGVTL